MSLNLELAGYTQPGTRVGRDPFSGGTWDRPGLMPDHQVIGGPRAPRWGKKAPRSLRALLDTRGTTGPGGMVVPLDRDGKVPRAFVGPPQPSDFTPQVQDAVSRLKGRATQLRATNLLSAAAATMVLAADRWSWGELLDPDHRMALSGWAVALQRCSSELEVFCCAGCGSPRTRADCCACSPCVREQKRRSAGWVRRALRFTESRPKGAIKQARLVTVSLRKTGDIEEDLEAAINLRKGLMRQLRKRYGLEAAYGAVELGEHDNVHVHAIVFSRYVPRDEIQTWLRSQDCTIARCRHPADDRCDACKAARVACNHLDGQRRRCDGSWVVDIRLIRGRKGLNEALKYAAKPVLLDDLPSPGAPPSSRQLAHAEKLLRYFLALSGRHRIETYGAAKDDAASVADPPSVASPGEVLPCSSCSGEMVLRLCGLDQGAGYRWFFANFGSA